MNLRPFLVTSLLFLVPAVTCLAQPDTIPRELEVTPFWMTQNLSAVFRSPDTVLACQQNSGWLAVSSDMGRSFDFRDTASPSGGHVILTKSGPLWRSSAQRTVQWSRDLGVSWTSVNEQQSGILGATSDGRRFWCGSSDGKKIVTTGDFGLTWDTLPFSASVLMSWLDVLHGAVLIGDQALLLTTDGGLSWDTLVNAASSQKGILHEAAAIAYVKIGTLATESTTGRINLSTDTGHTWKSEVGTPYWNIIPLRDSMWYATATSGGGIVRSTDGGHTWNDIHYTCPNGPGPLAFWDSTHGTTLQTAETTDGGLSWDCLDTTIYVNQPFYPSGYDASTYYGEATRSGATWLCVTTDRGDHWSELFPMASSTFIPSGHRLFFGFPDKVTWTDDVGQTFSEFDYGYYGNSLQLLNAPDGEIWAGNELKLFTSNDNGNTWTDRSSALPYRIDSPQLYYTFLPVDGRSGFVKVSNGNIFRTMDTGLTWLRDSIFPTTVIDSRHWISGTKITMNAGDTWIALPAPSKGTGNFLAIDSERWIDKGNYTTDAGTTWTPIAGWNAEPTVHFTAIDSLTAFGGLLWRLDMPWYQKEIKNSVTRAPNESSQISMVSVNPNPVRQEANISFDLSQAAFTTIEIFDVLGHSVSQANLKSEMAAGHHMVSLPIGMVGAGTYYVRLGTADGSLQTLKIVKE